MNRLVDLMTMIGVEKTLIIALPNAIYCGFAVLWQRFRKNI
jgi:hypothetical protein